MKDLEFFKVSLQNHPVSKAFIAELVEAAYEAGWHDQQYAHSQFKRPETRGMIKSATEMALDSGTRQADYLARVYSKEQGLKS